MDSENNELISEEDYRRLLKEYNSLRVEVDRERQRIDTAWSEHDEEVRNLLFLKKIIDKRIKERLQMSSTELFVISKTMGDE